MPYADAVHRHELRIAADAVLHVVKAHEDGQRQAVVLDYRRGDHAIPPCGVTVRIRWNIHLLVVAFVVYDIHELGDLQRWLRGDAGAIVGGDETGVFLLVLSVFDVEHRARDERLRVFVVDDAQQIVGAQDAFR